MELQVAEVATIRAVQPLDEASKYEERRRHLHHLPPSDRTEESSED